ncbi:hypothetical protein [Massilia sp. CCM 8734]|uniref:hypothetical protein n=1 Tax=Massilia sp. CCM 8734 TaxID=2609283 RepID=UPI001421AE92|nr:hypothetical protein [Massilia sp. CCM 8734]NHZ97920.1 hypothetical protein [Massilia sp. CCM 8734]
MSSNYEIKSYIGVGDLLFGMRPDEVIQHAGVPSVVRTNMLGERHERRFGTGIGLTYGKLNNGLVELGFSRQLTELTFQGRPLFLEPSKKIFKMMIELDGAPYEHVGFIVLFNLGITMTGFHDDDEEDKAVTVFARGRWDETLKKMNRFEF